MIQQKPNGIEMRLCLYVLRKVKNKVHLKAPNRFTIAVMTTLSQ